MTLLLWPLSPSRLSRGLGRWSSHSQEEAKSAGKIPYRVVVLGTDESIVEQDSDVPKVASVEVTEEQSEVKKLDTFSGGIDAHSLRLMLRNAALGNT